MCVVKENCVTSFLHSQHIRLAIEVKPWRERQGLTSLLLSYIHLQHRQADCVLPRLPFHNDVLHSSWLALRSSPGGVWISLLWRSPLPCTELELAPGMQS